MYDLDRAEGRLEHARVALLKAHSFTPFQALEELNSNMRFLQTYDIAKLQHSLAFDDATDLLEGLIERLNEMVAACWRLRTLARNPNG